MSYVNCKRFPVDGTRNTNVTFWPKKCNEQSWGVVTNPRLIIIIWHLIYSYTSLLGFLSWDIITLTYLWIIQFSIITFIHITEPAFQPQSSVSIQLGACLRLYPDQRSPWPWVEQKSTPGRFNHDESRNLDCWWLVFNTSTLNLMVIWGF